MGKSNSKLLNVKSRVPIDENQLRSILVKYDTKHDGKIGPYEFDAMIKELHDLMGATDNIESKDIQALFNSLGPSGSNAGEQQISRFDFQAGFKVWQYNKLSQMAQLKSPAQKNQKVEAVLIKSPDRQGPKLVSSKTVSHSQKISQTKVPPFQMASSNVGQAGNQSSGRRPEKIPELPLDCQNANKQYSINVPIGKTVYRKILFSNPDPNPKQIQIVSSNPNMIQVRKKSTMNLPAKSGREYIHLKFKAGSSAYTYVKISLLNNHTQSNIEEELVFLIHSVDQDNYFESPKKGEPALAKITEESRGPVTPLRVPVGAHPGTPEGVSARSARRPATTPPALRPSTYIQHKEEQARAAPPKFAGNPSRFKSP